MAYNSATYRRNVILDRWKADEEKGRGFNIHKVPENEAHYGCGGECYVCGHGKGPKRMFFSKPRRHEAKQEIEEQLQEVF